MKKVFTALLAYVILQTGLFGEAPKTEEKSDELITEGEVTVTSLDELKRYTDAGLFSQNQYDFYYDLISDDGEHEEFHSVVIPEFEITFTSTEKPDRYAFRSNIKFTVTESDLDTLPIGTYHKELTSGVSLFFDDIEETEDNSFSEIPEVEKLKTFLCSTYIWNTPEYGKGVSYPGMYNYICNRYSGEQYLISAEDFCRVAREEFGVENAEEYLKEHGIPASMDSDMYTAGGLGSITAYKVIDVTEDENTVTVIVQLYADGTWLLKSHKIAYKIGKDGKWLGYTILEEGRYPPMGLRYIADSMGGQKTSVPYFIYADEAAGEQVTVLASYGGSIGKTADGRIYAGTDGNRYDVLGIYNSSTQSVSYFSTYNIRSLDGEIQFVDAKYHTYTSKYVLSNGIPVGVKEGKYRSKLFSPGIGLVERTIEVTADGKIYLVEKCDTDSKFGGAYKGTYQSDEQTGEVTLRLTPVSLNSGAKADNKELRIVGKLLLCSYGTRTSFVPIESELESLPSDFPIALTLTPIE